ncbi:hypothetical protein NDA16_003419 [Ustilago loliicola]|nr:hypothetical protein NDA16_003419 [Ustilago loliicola]
MWSTLKASFVAASLGLITATSALASPVPANKLSERATSYVGYGFYYFTGNAPGQEQIYAAVSRDNTPSSWDLLNSGKPILTSTVGTKGVRDPSIVRSADGSKFYLIATDLNIGSGTSFGEGGTRGSRSIVVWESSDDLATWSEPRLVEVIGTEGGSAWAPEALYNPTTGQYDGDSVLDLTFLNTTTGLYRFIKNENPTSDPHPLTVYQEVSSDGTVDGTWTKVTENIGAGTIGVNEGPTAFVDNQDENKSWLWVDEYVNRGYVAFNSNNAAQGQWNFDGSASEPSNNGRHGTIIPLTQEQYDILKAQV